MTTGQEGRPDRRSGTPMSSSFDVLVTSLDALNAQVRGLRQDMSRGTDAQNRFGGGGGEGGGDASVPPLRRVGDYDPGAGRTSLGNMRRMSLGQAARAAAGLLLTPPAPGFYQHPPQSQQPPAAGGGQAPPTVNPTQGYTFAPPSPLGSLQGTSPAPTAPHAPGGGGGSQGGSHGGHGGPPHGPLGSNPAGASGRGGWTNSLLGAASHIPYVGTAMAVMSAGSQLYQSEREKNRFYQGMEGGSNVSGFGERAHEELYRWSMPGMSGDMSRRSFKGVTALGYTGKSQTREGRQDALNFVYHNYNARGMDVDESMGMLQSASRDATVTFGELSSALKEVSDTAGKAGVNAKLMRAQFQGLLETSITTGAGPGAAQLAGTFASTQASYGREFQNTDMSGQLSRSYQYMIGAQYGVAPGQLQGIMRNKPGEYARMVSGSQRSMIEMQLGPRGVADLQALIKKYGSTQQAIPQIEQEFLNAHPEIDLNIVADTLSGALTGVKLDDSNVMDWIIQQLSGNTAAAHTDQTTKTKPVDAKNTAGAQMGQYGLYKPADNVPFKDKQIQETFKSMHVKSDFWNNETNTAGKDYAESWKKTGKRDPVLEAILQNIKEPNKTNVRVATASGERIVSLDEAIRLFPNELAKGDVQVVAGNQSGQSISQIVNGQVDATRDIKGELTSTEGQKAGNSVKDYEKKYGPIKKSGGGDVVNQRVTVDLSTEAKQLLQLLPSVNNQSSATGYPPANPNPSQGSRP